MLIAYLIGLLAWAGFFIWLMRVPPITTGIDERTARLLVVNKGVK